MAHSDPRMMRIIGMQEVLKDLRSAGIGRKSRVKGCWRSDRESQESQKACGASKRRKSCGGNRAYGCGSAEGWVVIYPRPRSPVAAVHASGRFMSNFAHRRTSSSYRAASTHLTSSHAHCFRLLRHRLIEMLQWLQHLRSIGSHVYLMDISRSHYGGFIPQR